MYSLFNMASSNSYGILRSSQDWNYIRDGLRRNLGTVVSYYSRHPMAVASSHFLVRLLHSITTPQSLNIHRYWDNVDASALNISMALQMTSSIYQGKVFNGVFYGKGNSEILIATNESFDFELAHRNWKALQPIKVLRHPRSDLALNIPDGTNTGSEEGLVVISINIPLLAIQYRAFRMNEQFVVGDDSQRSIYQFLHMYPLPNMLYSHLDQALFNRLINLEKGAPLGESKKMHSFHLIDYTNRLNAFQLNQLTLLGSVGKDFVGVLKTIPEIVTDDAFEAMKLPDLAPTRQVIWALAIARLPALAFLFRTAKDGARQRNQSEVNKIVRTVLRYERDNLMRSQLPVDLYYDVQDEIQNIISVA